MNFQPRLGVGTSPIPMYRAGDFNYYNFLSSDGVWYIDVSGEIIDGQPLVAAEKGYLFPMIAGLTTVKYSPSLRRGFAGRPALPNYTFVKESDFGISIYTESNRLYFNPYPQLIKALTLP